MKYGVYLESYEGMDGMAMWTTDRFDTEEEAWQAAIDWSKRNRKGRYVAKLVPPKSSGLGEKLRED